MIAYLQGTVLDAGVDRVLLDVAGVGYELHVSLATFSALEAAGGGAVGLHVHTHLWSDGIALYGFWTRLEKRLFERLISVSGIGPRLARVILSGMAPPDLIETLAAGDAARLTTIPGVGRKGAERMVVELRDKVAELAAELGGRAPAAAPREGEDELVSALVNLGYKRAHAERAVRAALEELPEAAFHEQLRAALRRLSGMA
ncbi:MAG TPA: Holliday junction branch migration protein RuvA [Thermoanaerobaculia bacterium]|nr:Holliday junction branch migration protein RuvA [Thermoanaerobaculia bacterium]